MKVVQEELVKTGEACVDIAVDLTTALGDIVPDLVLGQRDAGNTQGGYDAVAAHAPVVEAAQTAVESLAAVFEADADALMLCAFAWSTVDEKAAEGLAYTPVERPGLAEPPPEPPANPWPQDPPPDVKPPSPSPGPAPTPSPAPTPTGG